MATALTTEPVFASKRLVFLANVATARDICSQKFKMHNVSVYQDFKQEVMCFVLSPFFEIPPFLAASRRAIFFYLLCIFFVFGTSLKGKGGLSEQTAAAS